jgi:hypothetical protein
LNNKRAHDDLPREKSNVSPEVDSINLTLSRFVLAALFVRATVVAMTTLPIHVLDPLLTGGRLVALRIATGCLVDAALLTLIQITLLSLHLISVVWHIYSSLSVS